MPNGGTLEEEEKDKETPTEELPDVATEETEEEETEDEKEPDFICGVILRQRLSGNGINIQVIDDEGGEVIRTATPNDMYTLAAQFLNHMEAIANSSKILEILADAGVIHKSKARKGRIIH